MYLAGIDIGTTSICVLLTDGEGHIVKTLVKENSAALPSDDPWAALQDPEQIWFIVSAMLNEIEESIPRVAAYGITGQMHGVLYIDSSGCPLSPLFTWQDQRGEQRIDTEHSYTTYLSQITEYSLATGYGMVTHFFNISNGKVAGNIYKLCTIADYITMKLSGSACPVTDPTQGAALGLFSLQKQRFDEYAIDCAGMDAKLLPNVVPSGTIVGHRHGHIPVICAIGDNQASFLGAVSSLTQSVLLNVGTGAQISSYSENLLEIEGLDLRPFPGGGFLIVGSSLSGGKSYALLERFFREICMKFSDGNDKNLYDQMNHFALQALQKTNRHEPSMLVRTQFNGTRQAPDQRGSIERITYQNFTPEQLIVGFLYGISDELNAFYEIFPTEIRKHKELLVGSGNAIRKNIALQQILQESFKLPLEISPVQEEAALGAAMHAGVHAGIFTDYQAAITAFKKR